LTGYGNDQSGVPLLLDLKPCCRKSAPAAFDSIKRLCAATFAAATPALQLPKDEKLHAGVPLPVIACMVRRAPLRSQAPQTLLASIDTPSTIAAGYLYCQSVVPKGPDMRRSAILRAAGGAFERCVLW